MKNKIVIPKSEPVTVSSPLAIPLEASRSAKWFDTARADKSVKPALFNLRGTEVELVARACAIAAITPEELAREAILAQARRIVRSTYVLGGGRGHMGSRDPDIARAYKLLAAKFTEKGVPLTKIAPARLAAAAGIPGNYRTAKRWLERRGLGAYAGRASGAGAQDTQGTEPAENGEVAPEPGAKKKGRSKK